MQKPKVLLEWPRPKDGGIFLSNKALKRGLETLVVTLVSAAVLELVIYWGFCRLPLNEADLTFATGVDLNFGRILIAAFAGIAAMCLICFIVLPLTTRYEKITYQLNEKGVFRSGRPVDLWKNIEDCWLIEKDPLQSFHVIRYRESAYGHERELILPTRDLADEVLGIFKEKIERENPKQVTKLNRRHVCFLLILCVTYLAMAYFLITHPDTSNLLKDYLLALTLSLGPGTIGMVCLVLRFRKIRNGFAIALSFNFISFLFILSPAVIAKFIELYKLLNSG